MNFIRNGWLMIGLVMCMTSFIRSEAPSVRIGEKLTYIVRWGFIPVGRGILKVKELTTLEGRPVYHVVAKARLGDLVGTLGSARTKDVKRALGYALDWAELKE